MQLGEIISCNSISIGECEPLQLRAISNLEQSVTRNSRQLTVVGGSDLLATCFWFEEYTFNISAISSLSSNFPINRLSQ